MEVGGRLLGKKGVNRHRRGRRDGDGVQEDNHNRLSTSVNLSENLKHYKNLNIKSHSTVSVPY